MALVPVARRGVHVIDDGQRIAIVRIRSEPGRIVPEIEDVYVPGNWRLNGYSLTRVIEGTREGSRGKRGRGKLRQESRPIATDHNVGSRCERDALVESVGKPLGEAYSRQVQRSGTDVMHLDVLQISGSVEHLRDAK